MAFEVDIKTRAKHDCPPPPRLRDEPIIVNKVYDSCRRQDCFEIVALAAEPVTIDGMEIGVGDVVPVPHGAGSVATSDFVVKKVEIVGKEPTPFKIGFWNVEVRFVFEYELKFFKCGKDVLLRVKAKSIRNVKFCLFGSAFTDFVTVTDLFAGDMFDSGAPTVWVDAKAVALKAEFGRKHRDHRSADVCITVGLFCLFKLTRLVCLNVQSRGFCTPRECDYNPTEPCEFFHGLDFPMDTFAPPKREDFKKGLVRTFDEQMF